MIKSKLPQVSDSIFTTMSRLAQKYDALNLSQGFPSFPVDPVLKSLHQEAIGQDQNQYAPMAGLPKLRIKLSQMTQEQHGAFYDPDTEICLTAGATQGIFSAIQATVHQGDEVILFTPAYDCYAPAVELAGGKVIAIPMQVPEFTIDWEQVERQVSDRTRMIIINSPHNPSGNMLTQQDMLALQEIVLRHQLYVLSDEVYEYIAFDGRTHYSAAAFEGLRERSFVTGSFGKTFHVTGWKMGYCLAPKAMMQEFFKVHQYVVYCVNRPVQQAIAQYLKQPERYTELGKYYQRKRDLFLNLINESRFKYVPTHGSYFQLLDYSAISEEGDVDFAKRLTRDHKIAGIPISVFMDGNDPKMLRFCFAKEDEELVQAATILNRL
ncbi:methionine aminotransferase [Nonlabens xiamenensis]|uniref:methionine aminotransferase n=1 Tax=Nonlabens xiamenensis TaxID=2341043 RepID=UPI000F609244|nr:methionine aminotransferase [Nonlabens xiamenensis]